ncbi:MAG: UDP-N-acetylmuramate dehydrogenase [Ruminococcaceae bacterium]|nr:UDP-N-acetylmuramate dehydrogenase [Oscillospiraceae bacterium]
MYDIQIIKDLAEQLGFSFIENEPLSRHTSFKIGGDAEMFLTVYSIEQLKAVIKACNENDIPLFILGRGSNLLISDDGMKGVVLTLDGDFKNISVKENTITCGAGANLTKLCTFALSESLSGLEFAYGIPGSVGGAAYMNAGAYGGEMKDVVASITHITRQGEVKTLPASQLDFSYRHSVYKTTDDIILFVTFDLNLDNEKDIKAKMDDFMTRRKTKQPLEFPSAGSVFKRPQGNYAGTLIEKCGLKGKTIGGAQVSQKHAGFIINIGDATCNDVLELVKYVQDTVKDETGYFLEREIIHI